jgi:hypothetical protein
MPGCVIDLDAHVDSDGGIYDPKILGQNCLVSGPVISDQGSESAPCSMTMAKTAKHGVLRCLRVDFWDVFWVYFMASPLDLGGQMGLVWAWVT